MGVHKGGVAQAQAARLARARRVAHEANMQKKREATENEVNQLVNKLKIAKLQMELAKLRHML